MMEQDKVIREIMSQKEEITEPDKGQKEKEKEKEGEKEEAQEETEQEKNMKITQRRECAWPQHWWEPRVTEQEDLTIMVEGPEEEVKLHITEGWNQFPIEALEPMLWFWTNSMMFFWWES